MFAYLIVCPLVFLAGFVDSIAGGGGLISLPAYMFTGLPVHAAIATNKMSSSMGTTVSTIHFFRQGYIKWKICVPSILAAMIGSWTGAHISMGLDENILKTIILVLLPFIAFYVMKKKKLANEDSMQIYTGKAVLLCFCVSLVVGIYDGLYGPGTGTFLLLLFTGLCRLNLQDAAGTTKVINLTTNLSALAVFLVNGKVLLPLGIAAGLCNMAGNYLGSHRFSKDGVRIVRPVILVVLVIFFVKTVWELL